MLWIIAQACTLGLDATNVTSDELYIDGVAMETAETNSGSGDDVDANSDDDEDSSGSGIGTDLDGDGYGIDDCDDDDPTVHPDQYDGCDQVDTDCDGEIDEDAVWDEDPSSPIYDLGEVYGGDVIEFEGLLFPQFDKDVYEFYVSDGLFGWFFIDALAESASMNTDIMLKLIQLDPETGSTYEFVFEVDDNGTGESELLSYDGRPMWDDSGTYQIEVTSMYGSDCELPYSLTLAIGT